MLDAYYALRGWTSEGIPTPEKLQSLGLDEVVGQLR
jgi:aldehyde:ferredoxin oxidoreductase